jgi:hypothetical protein
LRWPKPVSARAANTIGTAEATPMALAGQALWLSLTALDIASDTTGSGADRQTSPGAAPGDGGDARSGNRTNGRATDCSLLLCAHVGAADHTRRRHDDHHQTHSCHVMPPLFVFLKSRYDDFEPDGFEDRSL